MSEVVKGALDTWKGVDPKIYSRIEVVENTNVNGVVSTRTYAIDDVNKKRRQVKNVHRGDAESLEQAEQSYLSQWAKDGGYDPEVRESGGSLSGQELDSDKTLWDMGHSVAERTLDNNYAESIGTYHASGPMGGEWDVLRVVGEDETPEGEKLLRLITRTFEVIDGHKTAQIHDSYAKEEEVEIFPPKEDKERKAMHDEWNAFMLTLGRETQQRIGDFFLSNPDFDLSVIVEKEAEVLNRDPDETSAWRTRLKPRAGEATGNSYRIDNVANTAEKVEKESFLEVAGGGLSKVLKGLRELPARAHVAMTTKVSDINERRAKTMAEAELLSPEIVNPQERRKDHKWLKRSAVIGGLVVGAWLAYKVGYNTHANHSVSYDRYNDAMDQIDSLTNTNEALTLQVTGGLDQINQNVDSINHGIEGINQHLGSIDQHLDAIDHKLDAITQGGYGGSGSGGGMNHVPEIPSGGSAGSGMNSLDLSHLSTNTISARTPEQFVNGAFDLLQKQGIDAHGVNTERINQIVSNMRSGNFQIVSGMEFNPAGGTRQHIVDTYSNWSGGHTGNYQASGEQAFTNVKSLKDFMKEANKVGITFSQG